jgi:ferredoxin
MIEKIRKEAENFLSANPGAVLYGFVPSSDPLRRKAAVLKNAGEVKNLVWDSFCGPNLAVYLPRVFKKGKKTYPPKVGIVVKGCDARSIVNLVNEKQAKRENLFIIGAPCSGIVNPRKAAEAAGGEIISAEDRGKKIMLRLGDGQELEILREEILFESCKECRYPTLDECDALAGAEIAPPSGDGVYRNVADFEAKTPAERWAVFEEEMKKCIRCNACRQACPNCYCVSCFAEQNNPCWLGVTAETSDTMFFHIVRMMHQTGRCVDCGACVRACPMGLDLRLFTRKIVKESETRFGHIAGLSLGEPAPLNTYLPDDAQEFIVEP